MSVVARRREALEALARDALGGPGRVVPLPADYAQGEALVEAIRTRCDEAGPTSAAAAWIHSTAPDAALRAARALAAAAAPGTVDFVHVLSRVRTADPRAFSVRAPAPEEAALLAVPGVRYRRAILGWVLEPRGPRWLSDEEIAAGVIGALDSGAPLTAIGRVDPVESSPSGEG